MNVYDIILNTPLGKKKGELKTTIESGELIGFLSLLGHTEPIRGMIDQNGRCSLKGRFITLMRSVDFTADGIIEHNALRLAVKGGRNHYEMTGALRGQKEHD